MVLEGVGWDIMEFPESNLHVCGRDGTKIVVYSMGRCTRKGDRGRNPKFFFDKTVSYCKIVEEQDNII